MQTGELWPPPPSFTPPPWLTIIPSSHPGTPRHLPFHMPSSPFGISEPTHNCDGPIFPWLESEQPIITFIVKSVYTFVEHLLLNSSSIASILPVMWAHTITHTHTQGIVSPPFPKLIIYLCRQNPQKPEVSIDCPGHVRMHIPLWQECTVRKGT